MFLRDRLRAARSDFAALPSGGPLVDVCEVALNLAGDRPVEHAANAAWAAQVLTACVQAGVEDAAALTGAVLAHLGVAGGANGSLTLAQAYERHKKSDLWRGLGEGSKYGYALYLDHLVGLYGDRSPRDLTASDVRDAIAQWQERQQHLTSKQRHCDGRGAEDHYIKAVHHLWNQGLVPRGEADASLTDALPKLPKRGTRRRGLSRTQCRIARQLLGRKRDRWKWLCVILLAERLGMRRNEIATCRLSGLDLQRGVLRFVGKGGVEAEMPLPPGLWAFLRRYVEDRCPKHMTVAEFLRLDEALIRNRPTAKYPNGRPTPSVPGAVFAWLRDHASDVFGDEVSLHSYRYTLAARMMQAWGRAVARAALRHGPQDVTDIYAAAFMQELRQRLTWYENWLEAPPVPGEDDEIVPEPGELPEWLAALLDDDDEDDLAPVAA